jgi:hypothetical protein
MLSLTLWDEAAQGSSLQKVHDEGPLTAILEHEMVSMDCEHEISSMDLVRTLELENLTPETELCYST